MADLSREPGNTRTEHVFEEGDTGSRRRAGRAVDNRGRHVPVTYNWCMDDDPTPPGPGDDLERPVAPGLRVGRLLGRGGSSCVWLVTDAAGRRFALKVAHAVLPDPTVGPPAIAPPAGGPRGRRAAGPSSSAASATARGAAPHPLAAAPAGGTADLAGEFPLLQRLVHGHLLKVHSVVETDQGPGLLMDFAPGGCLLRLVTSRGPLPIPEVVTALVPIAQALAYLHAEGAVHGDVTPGNILFTSEGKPLLGDFGTTRLLGSVRPTTAGTPGFIDPLHQGGFEPGADVFALAAVSWFALTGRIPGPAEQRPPLALIVPEVPVHLMQLIEDGLSADRDRRPTAEQFAGSLLTCCDPGPVNLVPAVHSSVLPELLTRPADSHGAPPSIGRRSSVPGKGRWQEGSTAAGSARGIRRTPSVDRRRGVPVRRRPRAQGDRPKSRTRIVLAVVAAAVAAAVAALLLVAGFSSTLDGVPTPAAGGPGTDARPEMQPGDPAGRGPAPAPEPVEPPADARRPTPAASPTPDGSADRPTGRREGSPAISPVTALGDLAALRAQAFATADDALLAEVNVGGSPAMTADRTSLEALTESGVRLSGLTIGIRDPVLLTAAALAEIPVVADLPAVVEASPGTRVSLIRATAALSAYTRVDAVSEERTGLRTGPGTEPGPLIAEDRQELIFILWDVGDGWRIHSVVEPPA